MLALEDARKYRDQSISILRQMSTHIHSPTWDALDEEEHVDVFFTVLRLDGTDVWTSSTTRSIIDGEVTLKATLPQLIVEMTHRIDRASTALSLLNQLRPIFSTTPHPMLNETNSRALSHPAGGKSAQDDFHDSDTQSFKRKENWGIYNVLSWSTRNLSPMTLEKNIRLVLPPTLVLMDDWEPLWRLRGVMVLDSWLNHMNQDVMRRMGVDKLLMDSLIHTLSLHSSPPLKGVLRVAVNLIKKSLQGKELAEAYTQVMEKGIINGWTYAPSGMEGRKVLITIAGDLELLCTELGDGIVRWLKVLLITQDKLMIDDHTESFGSVTVYTDSGRFTTLSGEPVRIVLCHTQRLEYRQDIKMERTDHRRVGPSLGAAR